MRANVRILMIIPKLVNERRTLMTFLDGWVSLTDDKPFDSVADPDLDPGSGIINGIYTTAV